jgi:hypothetical protein
MTKKMIKQQLIVCGITLCTLYLTGCQTEQQMSGRLKGVDLKGHDGPVYHYTLHRTITVDPQTPSDTQPGPQTMTETLDMLLLVEEDASAEAGTQTCKVTCKSIRSDQTDFVGNKIHNCSITELEGKSFSLTISNDGGILDDSELRALLKQAAKRSLDRKHKVLLKRPDLLSDVEVIPYTVFASAAKVHSENDFTQNQQFVNIAPTPWPVGYVPIPDHTVTSTVDKLYKDKGSQKAHIMETYAFADGNTLQKPAIYPSGYRMDGLFGFMRKYDFESMAGTGETVYNMDTARIEKRTQIYAVKGTAAFTMPIKDAKPTVTINQTTTVELIRQ